MASRSRNDHGVEDCVKAVPRPLADIVAARHSCRAFLPMPVPRGVLTTILELAQQTPSWSNVQPWQVYLLSGAALDRLRDALLAHAVLAPPQPDFAFPEGYRGVYGERRLACALQLYDSVGVRDRDGHRRQAAENYRFFGAPHVAIVTTDRDLGAYGMVDCGAYVATLMLAAHSVGVASIAQASVAAHATFLRERLGAPPERAVVCAVALGFEDTTRAINAYRTQRASLDEVVTWIEN